MPPLPSAAGVPPRCAAAIAARATSRTSLDNAAAPLKSAMVTPTKSLTASAPLSASSAAAANAGIG
eukprot:3087074-Pyramimonas_sp.AAC.1